MDITQDHIIIGLIILVVLLLMYNKSKAEHYGPAKTILSNTSMQYASPPVPSIVNGEIANMLINDFLNMKDSYNKIANGTAMFYDIIPMQSRMFTMDDVRQINAIPPSMSVPELHDRLSQINVSSIKQRQYLAKRVPDVPITVFGETSNGPVLKFDKETIDIITQYIKTLNKSTLDIDTRNKVCSALYAIMLQYYLQVQRILAL